MEEWRTIEGYEGLYEVSNMGRVRSLDRSVLHRGCVRLVKGRVLKLGKNKYNGYIFVNLCKDGKGKPTRVHRLVAEAFIPNPEFKRDIDHINTIRNDNRVENLRWATRSENNNNPITLERQKNAQECKPVAQYTLDGELIAVYPSINEAARKVKGNAVGVQNCCNGKYFHSIRQKWVKFTQYKGYVWKYHNEEEEP